MLINLSRSLFFFGALALFSLNLQAQDIAKVILVNLDVPNPDAAKKCYSSTYDAKKVELTLDADDPILNLEDFRMTEDDLEGPGCFMPDIKLIFKNETYVFSLYCTSVQKYSNSAPFTPSSKRVKSDVLVTESVYGILVAARKKHFGQGLNTKYVSAFVKRPTFSDDPNKVDDSILYENDDDDEDDDDLEKDAIDQDGWFDNNDPSLDPEDVDDDDEGRDKG